MVNTKYKQYRQKNEYTESKYTDRQIYDEVIFDNRRKLNSYCNFKKFRQDN